MKTSINIRTVLPHMLALFLGCLIGWHVEKIVHHGMGSDISLSLKWLWIEAGAVALWLFWNLYSAFLAYITEGDFSQHRRRVAWTYLPFLLLLIYPLLFFFPGLFVGARFALIWLCFLAGMVIVAKLIYAVSVISSKRWGMVVLSALVLGLAITEFRIRPLAFFDAFTMEILLGSQLASIAILGIAIAFSGMKKRHWRSFLAGALMIIGGIAGWRPITAPETPPTLPSAKAIKSLPQAQALGLFSTSKGVSKVRIAMDKEHRDAFHFTEPGSISETAPLGPEATLKFGVGVPFYAAGLSDEGITFSLLVNSKQVWSRKLDPVHRYEDRCWYDEEIDLNPWTNSTVELTLFTKGARHGSISTPRLVSPRKEFKQPNIVVLLIDTLRADHVGFNGYHRRRISPNLDKLASQGTVFEHTISTAPWTEPATASLLTGMLPGQLGLGLSPDIVFSRDSRTLGEYLRSESYVTAGFSANPMISSALGFDKGFDLFNERCFKYFDWRSAECLTEEATKWLNKKSDSPFFLYLHYMDPHAPYNAPQPFHDMYSLGYKGKNEKIGMGEIIPYVMRAKRNQEINLPQRDVQYLIDQYDAEIAYVDNEIGRLVKNLKQLGLFGNTVIVITSDHGEEFLEHGILGHLLNLHQTLLHVPLVLLGPGIPQSKIIKDPISLADVLPALLDMLNIPIEQNVWGKSFLPRMEGHTGQPRICFSQRGGLATQQWSVLVGHHKLMMSMDSSPVRLFDLRNDPGEYYNRAGKGSIEEERLKKKLRQTLDWIHKHQLPPRKGDVKKRHKIEEERRRRLKALGYIGN